MKLRNINYGRRNPPVELSLNGMPATHDQEGNWPGSVSLFISSGVFQGSFHIPIRDAKQLCSELTKAIDAAIAAGNHR